MTGNNELSYSGLRNGHIKPKTNPLTATLYMYLEPLCVRFLYESPLTIIKEWMYELVASFLWSAPLLSLPRGPHLDTLLVPYHEPQMNIPKTIESMSQETQRSPTQEVNSSLVHDPTT